MFRETIHGETFGYPLYSTLVSFQLPGVREIRARAHVCDAMHAGTLVNVPTICINCICTCARNVPKFHARVKLPSVAYPRNRSHYLARTCTYKRNVHYLSTLSLYAMMQQWRIRIYAQPGVVYPRGAAYV